jgi:hypothetical protein
MRKLSKAVAILSVTLLIVSGQCIAMCATPQCSHITSPAPGQCHKHNRPSSPGNDSPKGCPQHEQSLTSNADSYRILVLHGLDSSALLPDVEPVTLPTLPGVTIDLRPASITSAIVSSTILRV